jgi:hypothetical protein
MFTAPEPPPPYIWLSAAQVVISVPAVTDGGVTLKRISTSSVDGVHGPLEIVQRNVYVTPVLPEKEEL